jgi:hypothetical protein
MQPLATQVMGLGSLALFILFLIIEPVPILQMSAG